MDVEVATDQQLFEWVNATPELPWSCPNRLPVGEIKAGLEAIWYLRVRALDTAFMEEVNRFVSVVERQACARRILDHISTLLYLIAEKLTLPCY